MGLKINKKFFLYTSKSTYIQGFGILEVVFSLMLLAVMAIAIFALLDARSRIIKHDFNLQIVAQQMQNMAAYIQGSAGVLDEDVIKHWENETNALLPQGKGVIKPVTSQQYSIKMVWREKNQHELEWIVDSYN